MHEAKVACILITRISTFLPCNFSCCPIFSGYEPAVITPGVIRHTAVYARRKLPVSFLQESVLHVKRQWRFCPRIFISSCPVLSGYESAVITRCNHKVYARRNLPVFLLQQSVSCPVLSGDKSTVITRCKQGESCLYSFYKTQYVFARILTHAPRINLIFTRNFKSWPVLPGPINFYQFSILARDFCCCPVFGVYPV